MSRIAASLIVLLALASPTAAAAQSVVVDQGTFIVHVNGREVGTEEFAIRRAGFGPAAAFIADAIVTLRDGAGPRELRPLLRATGTAGATEGYQLNVTGSDALEIRMTRAEPRFFSRFQSEQGVEEREFRARPNTRVVDVMIAHHFYFLRDISEGESAPILVPSERREATLAAGTVAEDEIVVGPNPVPARRVSFSLDGEELTVWFDRQGRVLRVEVPARAYVAERRDVVG